MITDTRAALWSAIDAYGCDAAQHGALGIDSTTRSALDRAIAAHVEAEVARRLEAADSIDEAIEAFDAASAAYGAARRGVDLAAREKAAAAQVASIDSLRAAIAADRARAVAEAVDLDAIALAADLLGRHLAPTSDVARGAVARLEAMLAGKPARPTPDEARRLAESILAAVDMHSRDQRAGVVERIILRALGVEA